MIFQALTPALDAGIKFHLLVEKTSNGQLAVTVLPDTGSANKQLVAKTFTATAEELDAGLADVLLAYCEVNNSLMAQMKSVQEAAEALAHEAKAPNPSTNKTSPTKFVGGSKKPSPTLLPDDEGEGEGEGEGEATPPAKPKAATTVAQPTLFINL